MTLPQIGGMFNGDRARKLTLVEYGFRLPSALDNRPLMFDEFLSLTPRAEPVDVLGLTNVRRLALGYGHACALREGGTLLGTTNRGDPFHFPQADGSYIYSYGPYGYGGLGRRNGRYFNSYGYSRGYFGGGQFWAQPQRPQSCRQLS